MKTNRIALGMVLVCAVAMVTGLRDEGARAEEGRALKAATRASLPCRYDYIEVGGELLRRFSGTPIKRLSLLALKEGALTPIPFQIDERDPEGSYVMTGGKTAGCDADRGRLDGNDELVFLAEDAGDRLPTKERLSGGSRIELQVTDPRYPDRHAWAYLARYDNEAPCSGTDYIKYDPPNDRVITECCIIGYKKPSGFMFYND